jgi:hypothetical protein
MRNNYFLPFLLLCGSATCGQAQKIVRGTVQDERNEPLPGVNVSVSGTESGTLTDM